MKTSPLQQTITKIIVCILAVIFWLDTNAVFAGDTQRAALQANDTTIYTKAEKYPAFAGGVDGLVAFINKNLKYPPLMLKYEVEGKVLVQFVVEKDGKLSNIRPLKGPGRGSLEEAVRITKLLPKWEPGLDKAGQAIRVQYQLPVVFKLAPADIRETGEGMKVSTY
ncbi:energy transducer TonB [Mucilaginibacter antarcticus]|uniref:Energy transducer TonB n=1 Tax=Mucilaginibacter antarcticus TaxID=1855725 RepID=A0ABW5XK52_9SPHI